MYVYVCLCVHVHLQKPKEDVCASGIRIPAVYELPFVLGNELRSSWRAGSTLSALPSLSPLPLSCANCSAPVKVIKTTPSPQGPNALLLPSMKLLIHWIPCQSGYLSCAFLWVLCLNVCFLKYQLKEVDQLRMNWNVKMPVVFAVCPCFLFSLPWVLTFLWISWSLSSPISHPNCLQR